MSFIPVLFTYSRCLSSQLLVICLTQMTLLAHCVSSDLKMSRGIAVQFREKFHEYSQLPTRALVGEVLVFQSGNRYIFSLITKRNIFLTNQHMKLFNFVWKTYV